MKGIKLERMFNHIFDDQEHGDRIILKILQEKAPQIKINGPSFDCCEFVEDKNE